MKKRIYYGWVELAVIWIVNFLGSVPVFYAFGIVAGNMSADIGMSMTALTAAYTARTVICALIGPLHGRFVSRWGTRLSNLLGLALGAVAYAGFAMLKHSALLYFLLWLVPVSINARFSGAFCGQITVSRWFSRHRGLATGVFFASGGVGGYVFAPLLSVIMNNYSWHGVWLFLSAACLICFFLVLIFFREWPETVGEEHNSELLPYESVRSDSRSDGDGRSLSCAEALRSPAYYGSLLIFVLSQFVMFSVCNTGIQYLSDIGADKALAASAVGAFALISTFGRLLAGFMSDRTDIRLPMAAGCAMCFGGMLMMHSASSAALIYSALILTGLGYGIVMVAPLNLLLDYYGAGDYANILSWHSMMSGCAAALFPVLFGVIYDRSGGYAPVWYIGAALSALCMITALLLKVPDGGTDKRKLKKPM